MNDRIAKGSRRLLMRYAFAMKTQPLTASVFLALSSCCLLIACGGKIVSTEQTQDATPQDASSDTTPITDSQPTVACPTTIPTHGTPCTRDGLVCQFGDDPRGDSCRQRATCNSGKWEVPIGMCPPVPTDVCPATLASAKEQPCKVEGAYCSYDGLSCLCSKCDDSGPVSKCDPEPKWRCQSANPDSSCPKAKPNLGTACSSEGKTCTYRCGASGARKCSAGVWIDQDGGSCPVSMRDAKTDVRSLSEAQLRTLAEDIYRLQLSTYRYKDASIAKGQRLGFIIEDTKNPYLTNDQRTMVDLYGYTSMLAAAVQTQRKEIEALKQEIQSLKKAIQPNDSHTLQRKTRPQQTKSLDIF